MWATVLLDPTVEGDCELQCCERPCVDLENMFACPEGMAAAMPPLHEREQ